MRRASIFLVVLLFPPSPITADDKAGHAKAIEAEIAKLEARIAELKTELATLRPAKKYRITSINTGEPKIGQVGRIYGRGGVLADFRIREIINDKEMIVSVEGSPLAPNFYLRGYPTKGLVEDRFLRLPEVWHVAETKKHRYKTYYVLDHVPGKDVLPKK